MKVELKSDSKAESQVEQTTCEPKLEQTATLPSIEKEDTRSVSEVAFVRIWMNLHKFAFLL